jgi:RNA polymerase sigma factor (TIGR02999 family)
MSEVTRLLSQIDSGNSAAADQLLPLVYEELRKLAAARLAHEKPGQTLQPTALVHEAYLRLVGPVGGSRESGVGSWNDRAHFFRAAAEAMRRILVDNARRKRSAKHGGELARVELADVAASAELDFDDVIAVSEALARFEQCDPAKAELVKLRFFAGLTIEEAAALQGISRATAERHWAYAKTWIYREMTGKKS